LDDNYQTYVNRVLRLPLPETYQSQLQNIQESPKFQLQEVGGERQAVAFPGYTVVTPQAGEEAENQAFYANLKALQGQLQQQLDPNLFVPVPPDSFHLTVADLIWDHAYRDAAQNPEFEQQLRDRMAQSFQQYRRMQPQPHPVRLQAVGLIVMPRAIGVGLVPKEESAYEQLIQLRRAIYQNLDLMALGIEQQYHFTGHVTLGYFGSIPPELDRDRLSELFSSLNQQWITEKPQEMWAYRAELRKFDDMTRYYRESDWPAIEI
jgi:2'-5' RNA ligase